MRSPTIKCDVGRQIRAEFAAGIIGINFHGVGDHILGHGGVEPYFAHLPGKDLAGVSIHGEGDRLARFDPADIRFIDRNPDLETIQVLGQEKEAGSIEAGHDGLADVDPPVDDDPFDRRDDGAVTQVLQGPLSRLGLGLGHGALRLDYGGFAHARLALATS